MFASASSGFGATLRFSPHLQDLLFMDCQRLTPSLFGPDIRDFPGANLLIYDLYGVVKPESEGFWFDSLIEIDDSLAADLRGSIDKSQALRTSLWQGKSNGGQIDEYMVSGFKSGFDGLGDYTSPA